MKLTGRNIWRRFRQATSRYDHPSQIALGICLGSLVGLLPKDSLLPWAIGCLAIISPANLTSTAIFAILCSLIGSSLDWLAHPIGLSILTHSSLQTLFARLQELPIVPWMRFENTVVTGLLAIGLISLLPLFLFGYLVARRIAIPPSAFTDRPLPQQRELASPPPRLIES